MSSKKGVGSSKNGRDSEAKRLGLKVGAGEYVSMLARAEMTLCLLRSTEQLSSRDTTRRESRSAFTAKKHKAYGSCT